MTPRAILELGCGEQGKHASDLTEGGQPRGGSEGVAQPNPGQQSHYQGTWGDLLPVPASLGFLFYFPGGERGGNPKPSPPWCPHVLCSPLPSSPSFHLSRNRLLLPLPRALSSSDSDKTPGKTKTSRGGFGDVQQAVEQVAGS